MLEPPKDLSPTGGPYGGDGEWAGLEGKKPPLWEETYVEGTGTQVVVNYYGGASPI